MKTNYFENCKTLQEVKLLFKKLAFEHHPDRGGNTQTMQDINAEYQDIIRNKMFDFSESTEEQQHDFIKYPEILNKIIGLDGITIEIIGNWIWVSGNTYPYRAQLKEAGLFFAHKKVMWYYRPEDYKSTNRKPKDIEEIRTKYGSDVVENKSKVNKLETA